LHPSKKRGKKKINPIIRQKRGKTLHHFKTKQKKLKNSIKKVGQRETLFPSSSPKKKESL
jgi:hypothetical protein